jgi:hypothetical protein
MSLPEKLKIADRAGSANRPDFCRVLEQELKPLYLLAFLLTANHRTAEQCFVATVDGEYQVLAITPREGAEDQ